MATILVFQKNIRPGKVKSRLARFSGNEVAAAIYEQCCKHTYQIIQESGIIYQIHLSDFIEKIPFNDVPDYWEVKMQLQVDNLGERMSAAFAALDAEEYPAILIGTDCMELEIHHLQDAFDKLKKHSVTLGPTQDGGYYLIGMQTYYPELFTNIDWSTSEVYNQTLDRIQKCNLSYSSIEKLGDIDTWEDWCQWTVKVKF